MICSETPYFYGQPNQNKAGKNYLTSKFLYTENNNKTASNQLSRNCNIIFLMGENTQFGNYLTKLAYLKNYSHVGYF